MFNNSTTYIYSWPLKNTGLNCVGPPIHDLFSINTISIFSLPYDFLNNIFLSLPYFVVIQYRTHITYKIRVSRLFMLLVSLPVNSRLLAVIDCQGQGVVSTLILKLFKGQLYIVYKYINITHMPWLVWLSVLSAGLWTKGLLVRFPVRAHAWVVGQVPGWGHARGSQLMFLSHIEVSLPLYLPHFHSLWK